MLSYPMDMNNRTVSDWFNLTLVNPTEHTEHTITQLFTYSDLPVQDISSDISSSHDK